MKPQTMGIARQARNLALAALFAFPLASAAPLCQVAVFAQSSEANNGEEKWCCCGACCGWSVDCTAVPGCTSCGE